jgi:arsenate reductase (glutaredoxin)
MEPVVYSYTGCGTCRKALQWLEARHIHPKVLAIRETPPSRQDLEKALAQLGNLKSLFNVSGGDYKELGLKARLSGMSVSEALDLLASRGNLVKRPFVRKGARYLVGFREEEWTEVFA